MLKLTPKQRYILTLIAGNKTRKQVADDLGITDVAVVKRILKIRIKNSNISFERLMYLFGRETGEANILSNRDS